jgi:hypothetical protein
LISVYFATIPRKSYYDLHHQVRSLLAAKASMPHFQRLQNSGYRMSGNDHR